MKNKGYYLMPHPPIIIPEIGRGEEQKIHQTLESLHKIGKEIQQLEPETIIIITPHGTMFSDAISLTYEETIQGDMARFGAPQVALNKKINKELTKEIARQAQKNKIPTVLVTKEFLKNYNDDLSMDHGALVPLYFIEQYYKHYNIVHITYAPLSDIDLYKFGMSISKAVSETCLNTANAVIIASGDLSHRLKEDGPYNYSPYGEQFDAKFLQGLEKGEVENIFQMDRRMINEAGECGRRSVLIMLGTLEGKNFSGELLSYEGTFGVGYGVMKLIVKGDSESKFEILQNLRKIKYEKKIEHQDPYTKLARESLTHYLTKGTQLNKLPDYVTDEMISTKRGVFVSINKLGNLRGCIGTITPTTESVAWEIIRNAVEAGMHDPRFPSIDESELPDLEFSVDELTEPEDATPEELNPKEYGVIVSAKGRRGLLLPDLEGVNTVEKQLQIALRKAGIRETENFSIKKFKVIRHKEDE